MSDLVGQGLYTVAALSGHIFFKGAPLAQLVECLT